MKLKVDEKIGHSCVRLLTDAGHDVATVYDQGLASAPDRRVADVSAAEGRCLVTLDVGFASPLVYPPAEHAGIAVLRLQSRHGPDEIAEVMRTLLTGLAASEVTGKLWVVQKDRIREYQPRND